MVVESARTYQYALG
ncbi:hypothetical protein HaLaN_23515, partial [Haematococcus lacustris]